MTQGDNNLIEAARADRSDGQGDAASAGGPSDQDDWRALLDRLVDREKLIEMLRKERDEYLDLARRAQADLANYRKRIARQQSEQLERAGQALLVRLLPLVDALDAAAATRPQTVEPLQKVLNALLESEGMERVDPTGAEFDPAVAEAVEHEGEGDVEVVAEVRRLGFRWKGRLLRPASVKVRSETTKSVHLAATGDPSAEEPERQG